MSLSSFIIPMNFTPDIITMGIHGAGTAGEETEVPHSCQRLYQQQA